MKVSLLVYEGNVRPSPSVRLSPATAMTVIAYLVPGIRSDSTAEVLYVYLTICDPPLFHSTLYSNTSPGGFVQFREMEEVVVDTVGGSILLGPKEERRGEKRTEPSGTSSVSEIYNTIQIKCSLFLFYFHPSFVFVL